MKDYRWFWLSMVCMISGIMILLWADKVINAHAREEAPDTYQDELEEERYYDSLELLAVCVEAEAGNQSLDGKRMVADVILNRVDHPDWPDSIEGVITDPYEFASYWDGGMDNVWEPSEETFQAVQMELERRSWPELYYFTSNGWPEYGTPWKKVGDHYFSGR